MPEQPNTPNPDQQTPATATVHEPATATVHDGTGARVLNFRPRSAEPVERSDRPTVVDGEIVDDTDVQHVAVDPPASTDLALPWRREVSRRPVVEPWLRSGEDIAAAARWAAGWAWHSTGFHTVRAPLYAARLTARAPRGAVTAIAGAARWAGDAESRPLREQAIRSGEPDQYLRLTAARAERITVRRRMLAAAVLGGAGALVALWTFAPPWLLAVLLVASVLVLGWVGSPADKPVTGRSVVTHRPTRLTSEMVVRALGALGLGEMNKALSLCQPDQALAIMRV